MEPMVPQGIAQASIAATVLSMNSVKKANRALENIYCRV